MTLLALLIAAYTGLLTVLATVSPGIGWLGQLLLVLPSGLLDALHAPAYGLLAWLILSALSLRGWPRPFAVLAGCALALTFGLCTETLQGPVSGRGPETRDLLIDGIGVTMAALIALTPAPIPQVLPLTQTPLHRCRKSRFHL